jgi:DNA-damage-inducible protein J
MNAVAKKRVQVQVRSELYDNVEKILQSIGLTQAAAINMFYKKIEAEGGIPFEMKISKRERLAQELKELTENAPVRKFKTKKELNNFLLNDEIQ